MVRDFARKHGSTLRGLAAVGGALATAAAIAIGAVLAVFFAATVVVIAVMASALLALAGLALRAKKARAQRREDGVIEARHLGGHHWVAYGWNERQGR
jgi:archaellum biogenesis protein FlaJ (TadC family)